MKKTISKGSNKINHTSKYHINPISLAEAIHLRYPKGFLLDCISRMYLIATAESRELGIELPLFPSEFSKSVSEHKRKQWDLYARNKIRSAFIAKSEGKKPNTLKKDNSVLLFDSCFKLDEQALSSEAINKIKQKFSNKIIDVNVLAGFGPFLMNKHHIAFLESTKSLSPDKVFIDQAVLEEINKPNFYMDPLSFIIQFGPEVYDLEKWRKPFEILWLIHEQTKSNGKLLIKKADIFEQTNSQGNYAENAIKKAFPKHLLPLFSRLVKVSKGGYRLNYYNS